jgi:hypothetical protein
MLIYPLNLKSNLAVPSIDCPELMTLIRDLAEINFETAIKLTSACGQS